jgi:hypothetical protein
MDDITVKSVAEALELMSEKGLVIRYKDSKGWELIQIADWWDWQTGLIYRAPSHYEAPKEWEGRVTPRGGDGKFAKE